MLRTGLITLLCIAVVAFYLRFLIALFKDWRPPRGSQLSRSMQHNKGATPHLATQSTPQNEAISVETDGTTLKTERKQFKRSAMTWKVALAVLVVTISRQAVAQAPQGGMLNSEPGGSPSSGRNNEKTSDRVNAEILEELERMRRRIQELESRLNQREADVKPARSAELPVTNQRVVGGAVLSSQSTGQQPVGASKGQTPEPKAEPFAFADWTWLNGNPRTKEAAFDSKFFTPEVRVDVAYHYDFNHPKDDTISGSSEVFRSNEVGLTHLGIGGDFHYDHVRARVLSQIGLYSTATPRNDASYSRGQWQLDNAYRYVNEAYGGYHFDALHGVNVDAGIFLSYVGLFSFYNFDNWAYQPSYVSSNTPWFFTGVRIQMFPTEKLKIEPWIINGWQSYARYNGRLGFGGQVLYRPTGWLSVLSNNYGAGADALGLPNRTRYHTDNSIEVKYYDHPERFLDKMAFSLTGDAGCETGAGVKCTSNVKNAAGQIIAYKQSFLGFMLYNRWWFKKDRYGFTLGGGEINNPGRYLVLLPPIDGATATTGTPYFTENPGDPFKAWDISSTYDYMPSQYITFRWEFNHRHANVPYWSGPGGVTPPGGNSGNPGTLIPGWQPDLRHTEDRATMAILVKF